MKAVLSTLLVISITLQVLEASRLITFSQEEKDCLKELDADEKNIWPLYFGYTIPEDNIQGEDFIHCVWNKTEFQNADGHINYENIKALFDVDRITGQDDPLILDQSRQLLANSVSKCENDQSLVQISSAAKKAVKVRNCIGENLEKEVENAVLHRRY